MNSARPDFVRPWRRLAVRLAQHAARVVPGARSPWARAMRHELDYIADDPAALRWAIGCVLASYRARLADRLSFSPRTVWRQVAASGALMLVIGVALLDNAGGQTPPPPARDEMACDRARPPSVMCRLGCADQRARDVPAASGDHSRDDSCSSKSKTR
jgi:hypothetical protein